MTDVGASALVNVKVLLVVILATLADQLSLESVRFPPVLCNVFQKIIITHSYM